MTGTPDSGASPFWEQTYRNDRRGPFKEGELARIYAGWRQEQATSYVLEDEHPGGVRHRHAIDKVVAWRE